MARPIPRLAPVTNATRPARLSSIRRSWPTRLRPGVHRQNGGMGDLEGLEGAGRFVGQPVLRKEDRRLVTGRGSYVDDVAVPDAVHAAFVRSDIARGRITRLDTAAAAR